MDSGERQEGTAQEWLVASRYASRSMETRTSSFPHEQQFSIQRLKGKLRSSIFYGPQ